MRASALCKSVVAAAAVLVLLAPAQAAFSPGNAVEVSYLYPNLDTIYTAPVTVTGPDDSLLSFAGLLNIVFSDSAITLTLAGNAGVNNVAFDGLRIVDLNNSLAFGKLALDTGATTYAGFGAQRISLAGTTMLINLVGLPGQAGQSIVLSAAPVPEPASWALMLGGLLGAGSLARRRR